MDYNNTAPTPTLTGRGRGGVCNLGYIEGEMEQKRQGLTAEEVHQSRELHGENVLTPPKRQSMWRLYFEKYQDPMVRILLVAAVVS